MGPDNDPVASVEEKEAPGSDHKGESEDRKVELLEDWDKAGVEADCAKYCQQVEGQGPGGGRTGWGF